MAQNQLGPTKNSHHQRRAHAGMLRVGLRRRQNQGIGIGDATLRRLTDVLHVARLAAGQQPA